METRILIIDDDILSSTTLEDHLKRTNFGVVGLVHSPYEAVKIVKETEPHVILMDIMFGESIDGIDTAEMITTFWDGILIFMTGHDDNSHIQRAKQLKPSGYILKPFNLNSVNRAIEIALHKKQIDFTESNTNIHPISDSIFISHKGGHKRLFKKDIICIEASGSYVDIHTQKQHYTLSTHLKNMGQQLTDTQFLRINRKYIINLNYISSMEGNSLCLKHFNKSLLIGEPYRQSLYNHMKIIKSK